MAETIVFSDSFTVSETKGAQSATVKRTVALKEILPGNDRMFSRVYVNKNGIVTGGVFAEDAGLPDDPKFGGHEGMRVPSGTSEQRPADGKATIRYNTELQAFEANEGGDWVLPFKGVNLKAIETDILPRVQSAQVYQLAIGSREAAFKSGAFGRLVLVPKGVLSEEDRAEDVLVNKNGTLYFGGIAIGGLQPADLTAATETELGGVKIGDGIEVQEDGTISIQYLVKASVSDTTPGTLFNKLKGIGGIALSVVDDPVKGAQVVIDGSQIDTQLLLPPNADYLSTDATNAPVANSLPANAAVLGTDANKKIVSKSIPLATAGAAGIVKVGSGLSVDGTGTISADAVSIPLATAGTAGLVKVGSGLSVDGTGTLSADAVSVPLATSSTVGTVKVGSGLSVDGAGSVSVPVASAGTAGIVKVGSGLSVDGTGLLSADAPNNDYIAFDTTPETTSSAVGTLSWNATDDTLNLVQPNGTTLQVGQEAQIKIVNKTGSAINNGQVVYLTGAQGNRVTAALAQANSFATSQAIAVATNTIADNSEGFVTQLGLVRELDTSAFAEGTSVYLSHATAGSILATAPNAPNRTVRIGYVVRSHATLGSIFVAIDPTHSFADLPDVSVAGATNGQSIKLNTTTNKWEPYTPPTITVSTSAPSGTPADGAIWFQVGA